MSRRRTDAAQTYRHGFSGLWVEGRQCPIQHRARNRLKVVVRSLVGVVGLSKLKDLACDFNSTYSCPELGSLVLRSNDRLKQLRVFLQLSRH